MIQLERYALKWQGLSNSVANVYSISIVIFSYVAVMLHNVGILDDVAMTFRMRTVFISSILVFLGAKLVVVFCPSEIKLSKSFSDFWQTHREVYSNENSKADVAARLQRSSIKGVTKHSDAEHLAYLDYELHNASLVMVRFAATSLLVVGLAIVTYIDIMTLLSVLSELTQ